MKGYTERVYKAVEIAGGKVDRSGKAQSAGKPQTQSRERMQAHFATLAHKGLVSVRQLN